MFARQLNTEKRRSSDGCVWKRKKQNSDTIKRKQNIMSNITKASLSAETTWPSFSLLFAIKMLKFNQNIYNLYLITYMIIKNIDVIECKSILYKV